ncbi:MAG: phosphoribosylaminoimidazolesuccinocarboxamide synthase [Syntrophothermus sp.]|uniref:phosphoribosylaminoimidazolesuccinocarboxamide synthase n=1 Tax=Syntrophothermus sp. TaxID=2736299 RepID=UPI00257E8B89|nr:phosphoribosylaminoimidazolesuccinocarboxamide synthase [Syntrophothermus sp.]NSW82898.1 phosphoribosylaminoimidazolesuccinocarboxamide synthase [Syntrophothermus sp.]
MRLVYEGKTKRVYELEDGRYLLYFKDDVTGEDGRIDPGSNFVLGTLKGKGQASLKLSRHFFDLLKKEGIPSHYIEADIEKNTMAVRKAKTFGRGLEVICRFKAYGSFIKRYGDYVEEFQPLDGLIEITLKDDKRGDPLINDEALVKLGLLTDDELVQVKELTRKVAAVVKDDLASRGLELVDIKFEFGKIGDEIAVIDDISGDNMRVFKNGHQISARDLADMIV